MDLLMEKLNALVNAWKSLPARGTEPDIPLLWYLDTFGMLWLDRVWVCPAKYVDVSKMDECIRNVQDVNFEVPVGGELLEVIIIREFDEYEIHAIERHF